MNYLTYWVVLLTATGHWGPVMEDPKTSEVGRFQTEEEAEAFMQRCKQVGMDKPLHANHNYYTRSLRVNQVNIKLGPLVPMPEDQAGPT